MSTIGGEELVKKYGSPLAVAEALLLGDIENFQEYVSNVVDPIIMEAAKFRVEKYLAAGNATLKDDGVLKKSKKS